LTREEILQLLTDKKNGEMNRKLLTFCREPKNFDQMERSGIKGDKFKILVNLKNAEGIAFVDGNYIATPLAIEVLKSLQ